MKPNNKLLHYGFALLPAAIALPIAVSVGFLLAWLVILITMGTV